MDPIAFHIGSKPIYWYGIMVALGFLAAVTHWNLLGKKEGRPRGFGSDFGFVVMFSGIIGGRLAYIIAHWREYFSEPMEILRLDHGGLIYYGGFIGGCIAVVVFARMYKESVTSLLDFAITAIPLGHALGRIGCFINGCCYGAPGNWPWCVYTVGAVRHPVQLYETAFNLALYAFLLWYYPRKKKDGTVLALYLMFYSEWRFVIEFLRGDERLSWLGFHDAQWISLGLFTVGILLWFLLPAKTSNGPKGLGPSKNNNFMEGRNPLRPASGNP